MFKLFGLRKIMRWCYEKATADFSGSFLIAVMWLGFGFVWFFFLGVIANTVVTLAFDGDFVSDKSLLATDLIFALQILIVLV